MNTPDTNTIRLTGTDAVQVRQSGISIKDLTIIDEAPEAIKKKPHRDGIQFIPERLGTVFNTQFAGAMIDNLTVQDCEITSDGKLQCLFCSDGGVKATIKNNTLTTDGQHYISLCLFDGEIQNNRDQDGNLVPIRLFPLRIGGNSDGTYNVYILTFKNPAYRYQPVENIVKDDTLDHVTDYRFGEGKRANSVYLYDFDLNGFIAETERKQHSADEMRELAQHYGYTEPQKEKAIMITRGDKTMSPFKIGQLQQGQKELKGGKDNPVIVEYFKATSYHATDDETPWCAAAHCWVHQQAGKAHTKSAAALSWLDWGVKLRKPVYGCTIVGDRGKGRGHVGFYIGETDSDYIIMGGNQNDSYCVGNYPKSAMRSWHFRKPKSGLNSKTNWSAGGIGTTGAGSVVLAAKEKLAQQEADKVPVEEAPSVPSVNEQICEMQQCPTTIPEGYKIIPSGIYDVGMGVGTALIALSLFIAYERLKKINNEGI